MTKKRKTILIVLAMMVFVVLLSPMFLIEVIYRENLAKIQKPLPSAGAIKYSKHIQEAFWYGYGENGEVGVIPEMPWTIFFTIREVFLSPQNKDLGGLHGSIMTDVTARQLMTNDKHRKSLENDLVIAAMSIWLSRHWTTEGILNEFIDKVYFGKGAYGITQASEIYFKKNPDLLDDIQLATLVASTKAPNLYSSDEKSFKTLRDRILVRIKNHGVNIGK